MHLSDNVNPQGHPDAYARFRLRAENPEFAGLAPHANETYSRVAFEDFQQACAARGVTVRPSQLQASWIIFMGARLYIVRFAEPSACCRSSLKLNRLSILRLCYMYWFISVRRCSRFSQPGHALVITQWKPELALSTDPTLLNLSVPDAIPTVKSIWKGVSTAG